MKKNANKKLIAALLATSITATITPNANAQGVDLGSVVGGLFGGGGASGGSNSSSDDSGSTGSILVADENTPAKEGEDTPKEETVGDIDKALDSKNITKGDFSLKGDGKVIVNMNITGKGGGALPIQLIQDGAVVAESVTDGRGKARLVTPKINMGEFDFSVSTPTGTTLHNARCVSNGGVDIEGSKAETKKKQEAVIEANKQKMKELEKNLEPIRSELKKAEQANKEFDAAKEKMFKAEEEDWNNFNLPVGLTLADRFNYLEPNSEAPAVLFSRITEEGTLQDGNVSDEKEDAPAPKGDKGEAEEKEKEKKKKKAEGSPEEGKQSEERAAGSEGADSESGETENTEAPSTELKRLGADGTKGVTLNPKTIDEVYKALFPKEESKYRGIRAILKTKKGLDYYKASSADKPLTPDKKAEEAFPEGSQERILTKYLKEKGNELDILNEILSWFDKGKAAGSFAGEKEDVLSDFSRRVLITNDSKYDTPIPWELFKKVMAKAGYTMPAPFTDPDPTAFWRGKKPQQTEIRNNKSWDQYKWLIDGYGYGFSQDIDKSLGVSGGADGSGVRENDYANTYNYMHYGNKIDWYSRWKYINSHIIPIIWSYLDTYTDGSIGEATKSVTNIFEGLGKAGSTLGPLAGGPMGAAVGAAAVPVSSIATGIIDGIVKGVTKKGAKNSIKALVNFKYYSEWFENKVGIGDKVDDTAIRSATEKYKKEVEKIKFEEVPEFTLKTRDKSEPANAAADGNLLTFTSSTGSEVNCSASLNKEDKNKDDLNTGVDRRGNNNGSSTPTIINQGGGSGLSGEDLKSILNSNRELLDKAISSKEPTVVQVGEGFGNNDSKSANNTSSTNVDDIAKDAATKAANQAATKALLNAGPKVDTGGAVEEGFLTRFASWFK